MARALSWSELQIVVVRVNAAQATLKLVHSNRSGALTAIEEAWIVRALHREDGLSQPELGRLMGHDKSWVNRRLALAEALSDELQADLRLGLIDATTGRELARLPRGNQREVAAVVQRRGLSTRQTQTLVEAWIAAPTDDVRASLLSTVRGTRQTEESPPARRPRSPAEWLHCEAEELRRRCGRLQGRLVGGPDPATLEDRRHRQEPHPHVDRPPRLRGRPPRPLRPGRCSWLSWRTTRPPSDGEPPGWPRYRHRGDRGRCSRYCQSR